jgi:hypothetical protein
MLGGEGLFPYPILLVGYRTSNPAIYMREQGIGKAGRKSRRSEHLQSWFSCPDALRNYVECLGRLWREQREPLDLNFTYELYTGSTTEGSEFESRWGQEFPLLHVFQTYSGVHPTSYPTGTSFFSSAVKRPELEADHSPPTSAEVKKTWVYTSTLPYAFMA